VLSRLPNKIWENYNLLSSSAGNFLTLRLLHLPYVQTSSPAVGFEIPATSGLPLGWDTKLRIHEHNMQIYNSENFNISFLRRGEVKFWTEKQQEFIDSLIL
jgi:hypothetical protein